MASLGICRYVAGQNLLVNGSFEDENICSEYKVNCAPEGWLYSVASFPYYFKEPWLAHSGTHSVSLIAGRTGKTYYRTYVRSRLLCSLHKGHHYKISFWIRTRHPQLLDSMGVYFSTLDFLFDKRKHETIPPSILVAAGTMDPVTRDTGWHQVQLDYTATGTEIFFTLGNFSRRDYHDLTGIDRESHFFVFFDDVALTPMDPQEQLCSDWRTQRDDIYNQDERHEFQRRVMKEGQFRPPQAVFPSATSLPRVDSLLIPDVLFESGSAVLNPNSHAVLDSFCKSWQALMVDSLVVEGHTDNTGGDGLNRKLSMDRAKTVADYIVPRTSEKDYRLVVRAYADKKPVASNDTPEGRQRNRRVEVFVYFRK